MVRWNAFPFVRYTLALMGGIVAYLFLPNHPFFVVLLLLVSAIVGLLTLGVARKAYPIRQGICGLLTLGCLGWGISWLNTSSNDPFHVVHLPQPIRAYRAVVSSQAENRTKTYRVELDINRVLTQDRWQAATGRLIVYLDKADAEKPRYGDVWLVAGGPRPIDPPLNPGEFNYKRFLANRGIYHQQYVKPANRHILGHAPPNGFRAVAYSLNEWADSVYTDHLGQTQEFAIVKAMILGIRDEIDPDLQQAYSAAGAVHILSVSGLHVGVLFGAVSLLLGFLKRLKGGRYLFAVLMLALLWFYALMTGFSAPVLRSAFMFSLMLIGQTINRAHNPLNTLAASAFLILLIDPYALTSAGFQLSYLAVGGLILLYQPLYQSITFRTWMGDQVWKLTVLALVAQLATFPLAVFYFHQFPTYFWLANPLVVPLSSLVLVLAMGLLVVGWIPFLGFWAGKILFGVMWLVNQCILWTEQLPASILKPLVLTPWELVWTYGIIVSALAMWMNRNRHLVWVLTGCAFWVSVSVGWTTLHRKKQRLLIVHFVPHQSAISLVAGTASTFLTRTAMTERSREVTFYVRNTWDSLGVKRVTFGQTDRAQQAISQYQDRFVTLLCWQGKRILLVDRLPRQPGWQFPIPVDYAIFRRNSVPSWTALKGRVAARFLIFDDSNRTPLTDRLLTEARQQGIRCHSVRQQGAYVARW
ncbi:ComEC/Rec2 family competence protein [Larkinella bovis]|uniref:ComEC/Rec2 family competence protein n=1 Tax=Larkinella bovis TaxID=683041 RepID=A0ABW0I858_9BACT